MKENKNLEFKVDVSGNFLKTVSAFANYEGGKILFGIADNGEIIGLANPEQACMDIENKINDTIRPQPDYNMEISPEEKIVVLKIEPGRNKPYMYKSKAYRRNDTATIEVDEVELVRLILAGKNMDYEELPANNQSLSFNTLEEKIKDEIGIEVLNKDILKTLNLYNDIDGYNHAAELLADQNNYPGIDIAKFGEGVNLILKRVTFERESILSSFEKAVLLYRDYYQMEEIRGMNREKIEVIPEEAFREAVANAIIHRTWDVKSHIRILMFEDRIEITSPGGLPFGISEREYIKGRLSVLRNPILSNVFLRLHLAEALGTGIIRIKEAYHNSVKKPVFEVNENTIKITLPVFSDINLSDDELLVYKALSKVKAKSISEIVEKVPFSRSKTASILKELVSQNYVTVVGRGRGTKYKI